MALDATSPINRRQFLGGVAATALGDCRISLFLNQQVDKLP